MSAQKNHSKTSKPKSKSIPPSFTMISGLAQELDAPLRSVVARTQKIVEEYKSKHFEYISYKDFKNILKAIEQVNSQLKHCCAITGRMIDINKRKAQIHTESAQINLIVKEILGLAAQQLERAKVKVVLRLDPKIPFVKLGPIESHQVIHNVLMNAVQSMPGGGSVKISTKFDTIHNLVNIDIIDEGVGINPEHLSKIFEPFFTTKEWGVEKSSGLGLSIVYSLITNVGGRINITSSLRKGTHVHISLPVV